MTIDPEELMTMKHFYYNMLDKGNCEINPFPLEIAANDLGHALQKIAAQLHDDTVRLEVWEHQT